MLPYEFVSFTNFYYYRISRPSTSSYNSSSSSSSKRANAPFSFQQKKTTYTSASRSEDEHLHIHGLNKSFQKSIEAQISKNPTMTLISLFKQYENHLLEITKKYSSSSSSPLLPLAAPVVGANAFNFGSTAAAAAAAPSNSTGFTFAPSTTASKPAVSAAFNFGSFTQTKPSAGSLSSTTTTATTIESKPSTGFSFGTTMKPATTSFNFGQATTPSVAATPFSFFSQPSSTTTSATTTNPFTFSLPKKDNQIKEKDDDKDDEDDGPHPDSANTTTNPDLIRQGEGEEEDENVLEVRCKLFQYTGGQWADLGIILFKINHSTSAKRYRVLGRSEGTGKLLLNNWISAAAAATTGAHPLLEVEKTNPPKRDLPFTLLTGEGLRKYMLRSKEHSGALELYEKLKELSS